jgi:CTP synthase
VIPHVTNAIKEFIENDTEAADIVLCEIGGTVGDIEGLPFFEAIRQFGLEHAPGQCCFIHVTLVPWIPSAQEIKTKPTQHSVAALRAIGIQPDILLCRADRQIPEDARHKIALQCSVRPEAVIPALDCGSIYEVPVSYHEQGLDTQLLAALGLPDKGPPDLRAWREIVHRLHRPEGEVAIAVVGKYTGLFDAYKSLNEALVHGGIANNVRVSLHWIDAEEFADADHTDRLHGMNAVLVPGGFGERGAEGKIAAVTYAREKHLPFLGICFGMQLACVEAARRVGLNGASSTEFGPCADPIVGLMTEWDQDGRVQKRGAGDNLGGTMRLGAYPCLLQPGSLAASVYGGVEAISERHRHRYEVNINYRPILEQAGLRFSGLSPDGRLPEMVELLGHPWFVGVQFHPELKSRPMAPHPLFAAFIRAALEQSRLV